MEPKTQSKNALVFIFVTVVLDTIGIGIIFPIMPDLLFDLGYENISDAVIWAGLLSACYALMQFLFSPVIGTLSDAFGRRKIILFALFAMCIDYLILGLSNAIWILFMGKLIAGITGSTIPTATAYLADISSEKEKAKNFGLIGAAFGLGFIFGPLIGGVLGEISPRAPFFMSACLAGLNFLFGFFVLPESLDISKRRILKVKDINPFQLLTKLFSMRELRMIFLCIFLVQLGNWVYPSVWSFWAKANFSWTTSMIGVSLAAYGVGIAFVQGVLIRHKKIEDLGPKWVILFCLLVGALALMGFGLISVGWLVFALIPFAALSEMFDPTVKGYLSNQVHESKQGELQGILFSIRGVTTFLSPILMTLIFRIFSDEKGDLPYLPGMPFIFAAVLLLISIGPLMKRIKVN